VNPLEVLCLGEALWDLHGPPGVPFAEAHLLHMRPGGAAVNVALALAARGVRAGLAAVVGDDPLGEALAARVAAAGVDVAEVARVLPRTGLLFAEHAGERARFVGYRSADEPAPALTSSWSAQILLLTGLMPAPDHAHALRAMAQTARAHGARVVVDANARPRVWRGRDPAHALAVLGEADVVKATADDAAVLGLGDGDDSIAYLRAHLREGAVLVVTAGPKAARALGGFGEIEQETEGFVSGSALGAGDAFTAGMLYALLRDGEARDRALWARALAEGHAAARAHLTRRRIAA
jgi:sugar/nucleoside kinase (ribokinase family)